MVRIKKLLIYGLIFILLFQLAAAASNSTKLQIADLDVTVDGSSDKDLNDGDTISKDAKPGATVKVKVKLQNTYTSAEDVDIENILITATLEGIDDGDDLEEEGDEFDIGASRSKSQTFTFDIPKKVDDDEYTLKIKVEGEDENNTNQDFEWTLNLDVKKEKHAIEIEKASFSDDVVDCTKSTSLDVKITNYGRDDEDEVTLEIQSSELALNIKEENLELSSDLFDEDSTYKKVVNINTHNVNPGTYPVTVNAYYNNDKLDDSKKVELTVKKCTKEDVGSDQEEADDDEDAEDEDQSDVEDEEEEQDGSFIVNLPSDDKKSNADDTLTVYAAPTTPTGQATSALDAAEKGTSRATYALIAAVAVILLLVVVAALLGVFLILRK